MQSFLWKGKNVTTDNIFTSLLLAHKLLAKNMYDTVYQKKEKKNVCIFSTMHTSVEICNDAEKRPETVHYYKRTEMGVDVLDKMQSQYSVQAARVCMCSPAPLEWASDGGEGGGSTEGLKWSWDLPVTGCEGLASEAKMSVWPGCGRVAACRMFPAIDDRGRTPPPLCNQGVETH